MLASDLNNPAFVDPKNPDSLLYVEFYWEEPLDKWATETSGKKVKGPKQPFVRIMKPGDKTSMIETPVREDHKSRWPDKWLYWQMQEGLASGQGDIPGWKIDDWTEIDEEQKRELKFLRFSVVEQIAGATDAQVQKMGMGGMGLRERAKIALRARMGAETRSEIEKKDREIADLKASMERLEKMITERTTDRIAAPEATEAPPPSSVPSVAATKKRGWPKGKPRKPKVTA